MNLSLKLMITSCMLLTVSHRYMCIKWGLRSSTVNQVVSLSPSWGCCLSLPRCGPQSLVMSSSSEMGPTSQSQGSGRSWLVVLTVLYHFITILISGFNLWLGSVIINACPKAVYTPSTRFKGKPRMIRSKMILIVTYLDYSFLITLCLHDVSMHCIFLCYVLLP